MPAEDRLWTLAETAEYVGVPEWTVRSWIAKGTAPRSFKVGKYRKFKRQDVDAWLETRASDRAGGAVA
jgi:excisionase family DNA binding protein